MSFYRVNKSIINNLYKKMNNSLNEYISNLTFI